MNSDQENSINTSQQPTKERLNKKLDGYFRAIKAMNWQEQVWTTNHLPHHELPQNFGGSKSVCPIWIQPTNVFLTHSKTSFSINKLWSNLCGQTCQQPLLKILKQKPQSKILWNYIFLGNKPLEIIFKNTSWSERTQQL